MPLTFQPCHGEGLFLLCNLVDVDDAFLVHIDDRDVAVGSQADRTLLRINLPDLGRVLTGDFDVLTEGQPAFIDLGENQWDTGFNAAEAGDAIPDRRLGKFAVISEPFSSSVWGEWSVASISTKPSRRPCHNTSA